MKFLWIPLRIESNGGRWLRNHDQFNMGMLKLIQYQPKHEPHANSNNANGPAGEQHAESEQASNNWNTKFATQYSIVF